MRPTVHLSSRLDMLPSSGCKRMPRGMNMRLHNDPTVPSLVGAEVGRST